MGGGSSWDVLVCAADTASPDTEDDVQGPGQDQGRFRSPSPAESFQARKPSCLPILETEAFLHAEEPGK
jgi:hypothetical protein